jgi:hypothetical protein
MRTHPGLTPVRGVSSEYVTGGPRAYVHDSGDGTALYVGDPVKIAAQHHRQRRFLSAGRVRAATTDVIAGVVVAHSPGHPRQPALCGGLDHAHRLVDDDPNSLFEIQDAQRRNGSSPLADVGSNVSFTGTGGDTSTGFSAVTLDNTTEARPTRWR